MNESINVVLCYGKEELELPIAIKRKDVTRAEIMGRLGSIPMKDKQQRWYKIEYLGTKKFIEEIEEVYSDNSRRDFKIPCNKDEFEQFDLDAYRKTIS